MQRTLLTFLKESFTTHRKNGIRDILVHEYFGVTFSMIWKLTVEDIPELKQQIDEILRQFELEN